MAKVIDQAVVGRGAWIRTFSGRDFFPLDPSPADVAIADIAHALSLQCRFTGHVRRFYSVAEHSIRVSYACKSQHALWGLLHDASEAYLVDVATPVKHAPEMVHYRLAERQVQAAICERFGLPLEQPSDVTIADARLLATENRDLMPRPLVLAPEPLNDRIVPISHPAIAERRFLDRFFELNHRRKP